MRGCKCGYSFPEMVNFATDGLLAAGYGLAGRGNYVIIVRRLFY